MERLTAFKAHLETLPGAETGWLHQHRLAALDAFSHEGFPTMRDEEWQFLSAGAFSNPQFQPQASPTQEPLDTDAGLPECLNLFFVNGRLHRMASEALPEGLEIISLQEAAREHPQILQKLLDLPEPGSRHGLSHLTAALAGEGVLIRVKSGVLLSRPIHLIHRITAEQSVTAVRHFIDIERHAEATVIESHSGPDQTPYLSLGMSRIFLDENASLDHYAHQAQGNQGRHFAGIYVEQKATSRFLQTQVALGGHMARCEIHSTLDRASECDLQGIFLAQDRAQIDTHTRLRHAGPHATSRDDYRGIAAGRGRGVFQGRIIVEPGAQKTQAEMQCRNLLLSQEAEIDAKPQLEIYADDVKCAHGLTVGQLDPGAIFYLASRGIGEEEAKHLLTFGFANEILERVRPKALQNRLQSDLAERLNRLLSKDSNA